VRADTARATFVISDFADGPISTSIRSGDVDVSGDLSKLRRVRVDTGNGDIKVVTQTAVSLDLEAGQRLGQGHHRRAGRAGRAAGTQSRGSDARGGAGHAKLDAGSGDIEFRQSGGR